MTDVCPPVDHIPSRECGGVGNWGFRELKSLARTIKDKIPPAIDGLAGMIQRSAMNLAEEFANLEREAALEASRWREGYYDTRHGFALRLPWEVPTGTTHNSEFGSVPLYEDSQELKAKILSLSEDEKNFQGPFTKYDGDGDDAENVPDFPFQLDEAKIHLIRHLLVFDENLATRHADSGAGTDETLFWKNYFFHCEQHYNEHMERQKTRDPESDNEPPYVDMSLLLTPAVQTVAVKPQVVEKKETSSFVDEKEYIKVDCGDTDSLADSQRETLSLDDVVLVGGEGEDLNVFLVDGDDVVFNDENM